MGLSSGGYSNAACNFNVLNPCTGYISDITRSGSSLQNAITSVQQHKFFLNGLISLPALQNGGMSIPNSNLLTANAFSALDFYHITLPQLATLNLFPVPSVDADMLLNAGYINSIGQTNVLSALGIQASIFGHIIPSQLESLNLYPLQEEAITTDILIQAGYLTSDCIPTALGLSALHIRYLTANNFVSPDCQIDDYSQLNLLQLSSAKYIYGRSNVLTPIGLAAMHTGFFPKDYYQRLNIFPFATSSRTPSSDYVDEEQTQSSNVLNELVHVGYLYPNNYLITGAAYHAITIKYFTIDHFRSLNVWPYPGTPSINMFVSAGYATYSGHLTKLGCSLLHAQYFPHESLSKLGIHLHDEYHVFHHALHYAGSLRSDYYSAHAAMHSNSNSNADNPQVEI